MFTDVPNFTAQYEFSHPVVPISIHKRRHEATQCYIFLFSLEFLISRGNISGGDVALHIMADWIYIHHMVSVATF